MKLGHVDAVDGTQFVESVKFATVLISFHIIQALYNYTHSKDVHLLHVFWTDLTNCYKDISMYTTHGTSSLVIQIVSITPYHEQKSNS